MPSVSQAVIPAAGLGTRFLPLTKVVPKELLPLGSKPAIAWIVDECLEAGIREICFVISRGKELIPKFFERDVALEKVLKRRGKEEALAELLRYDEVSLHVMYQKDQLGDAHAVLQAKDWIRSDPFAVLFPDDLILARKGCLLQILEKYEEGILFALLQVSKQDVSRYGIVDVEGGEGRMKPVRSLVEKPDRDAAPSTLAVMGRFLLPRSILPVLKNGKTGKGGPVPARTNLSGWRPGHPGGERRIVDAIQSQIGSTPVAGYEFEGTRFDLGTPEGYREAVARFGKK